MKINVSQEEIYPFYGLSTEYGEREIEIPEELYDRWKAMREEFRTVNRMIREIYQEDCK